MNAAGPQGSRAGKKIILPHAFEPCVKRALQDVPGFLKEFIPCHQSRVVVSPDVMDILDYQQFLGGFGYPGETRKHAIGENVFIDPWVSIGLGNIIAYGMEQEETFQFQTTMNDLHEGSVVF